MEEIWDDDQFLEALDWWEKGKSFMTIRRKLRDKGMTEERINYFIRMIDEYAIDAAYIKQTRQKIMGYIALGLFILLLGVIVLILSLVSTEGRYIAIPYGLILFGGAIAWTNYKRLRKLDPDIREKKMHFKGIKRPKT